MKATEINQLVRQAVDQNLAGKSQVEIVDYLMQQSEIGRGRAMSIIKKSLEEVELIYRETKANQLIQSVMKLERMQLKAAQKGNDRLEFDIQKHIDKITGLMKDTMVLESDIKFVAQWGGSTVVMNEKDVKGIEDWNWEADAGSL